MKKNQMKSLKHFTARLIGLIMFFSLSSNVLATTYPAGSPVAINGKLKVEGTQLVNECGYPVQLRGMSSHGPQWFGNCICNESLQSLVDDWNISLFRIAMYVQEEGYVTKKEYWRGWIDDIVEICGSLGIYCIIDWHVLNPGNPMNNLDDAKEFWQYMSTKHGSDKHVLYEICNEPNGTDWTTVKSYAETIVPIIRNNNDETVIIIGTPTWSQDVDVASQNKVSGTNIMYTLHFYAGSHGAELRSKAETALNNGAPIFVTEFGTSAASGDGNYSPDATKTWIDWMNQKKISWANWSYSDKGEVSGALTSGACNNKQWNSTTESGALIKEMISANPIAYTTCSSANSGDDSGSSTGGNSGNTPSTDTTKTDTTEVDTSKTDTTKTDTTNSQDKQEEQQTQPVTYPDLTNEIAVNKLYRIVNKNSGMVMTMNNSTADKAKLTQATINDQDSSQMFTLVAADGYYVLKNYVSRYVLTNQYQPNEGAEIVQQEACTWDNPTEKWRITKVDGNWFKIDNKNNAEGSMCIGTKDASKTDGAEVVQLSWNNKDNELWGFEYIGEMSGLENISNDQLFIAPTLVENFFQIMGHNDYDEVNLYSISGVKVKSFGMQDQYEISDLTKGIYFVEIINDNKAIMHLKIVKK